MPGYFDLGSTHFSFFLSARQLVILLSRELVLVNVIVGRPEGVVVRTFSMWERSVALFEEEEAVEDVRVLSGDERPRARRRRDLSGMVTEVLQVVQLRRKLLEVVLCAERTLVRSGVGSSFALASVSSLCLCFLPTGIRNDGPDRQVFSQRNECLSRS